VELARDGAGGESGLGEHGKEEEEVEFESVSHLGVCQAKKDCRERGGTKRFLTSPNVLHAMDFPVVLFVVHVVSGRKVDATSIG